MNVERAAAYISLLAVAAAEFFVFPGHTILQSDTQIYLPILEHLRDSSVLRRDLIATQPHVGFTLYDEVALALRAITGASFESILMVQQFLYRVFGLFGCYLLARSAQLERSASVLLAGVAGLGATIVGPAVLSVEYEPVPRGFALAWSLLGLGLLSRAQWTAAAGCIGLSLLFHPNTALPVWTVLLILAVWRRRPSAIAVLLSAAGLLAVMAYLQSSGDAQPLWGRISPALEELQRLRASYSWVSVWIRNWWLHYVLLWAVSLLAYWRIRELLSIELRVMALVLSCAGIVSIPVSYVFTEQMKWILMPQFQPGRYLVFTVLVAVLLSALAAANAARKCRWPEALAFLIVIFAVPQVSNLGRIAWTPRLFVPLSLAALALLALRLGRMTPAVVVLAAAFAIPNLGGVRNYPSLHTAEVDELARWAAANTPRDAVFQFAGVGRGLEPGVFRARSLRALYVDWKSGGQVNFLPKYSEVWKERWDRTEKPQSLDLYRSLGIDYLVYTKATAPPDAQPVFSTPNWMVYRLTSP